MSARLRAVVLLTGSELVRGDRRDENGAFLARELTRLGLERARAFSWTATAEATAAVYREAVS